MSCAEPRSLAELVMREAQEHPDAVALSGAGQNLTYAQLARRGGQLARRGAAGSVVGVCVPRGVDLIVSVLAVLAAGGAYLPLDAGWPAARRRALADAAGVELVLTCGAAAAAFDGMPIVPAGQYGAEPVALSGLAGPDNLAYVIFTSGSTGEPKPVAVTHRSVLCHAEALRGVMRLTPADRVLQFASIGFDAAAEELYPTWSAGARVVLLPDAAPTGAELERMVTDSGVTVLNLPTAYWHQWAAEVCRSGRRLPESLRLVVIGGEAASSAVARDWLRHTGIELLNTYGVTEATITSTALAVTEANLDQDIVPIGLPIRGTVAHVLDADLRAVSSGTPGELYLSGDGVSGGYLGRPELTAERFVSRPDGTRLYRTGDLVRRDPAGILHFLGRIDNQVKIRGHRVEPGEVAAVLVGHPDLAEAQVVAVGNPETGETELVAYVVPGDWHRVPGATQLRAYLSGLLPAALLPAHVVVLSSIPLGPTGKVDRAALPTTSLRRPAGEYHAPATPIEHALAEAWRQVLGVERVGVDDDLFELGAHSLTAIRAAGEIRRCLGVDVDVRDLFAAPTIRRLAATLTAAGQRAGRTALPAVLPGATQPVLPLSCQQEQVWFIGRSAPDSIAYQTQTTIRITGSLDLDVLDRAVTELAQRHEILRTTFHETDGRPYQVVHPAAPVRVVRVDLRGEPGDAARTIVDRELGTPFDVSRLPLVRWTALRLADDEHELVLIEHHLVHDGWSFALLMHELRELCTAFAGGRESSLPPPPVQYRDFVLWQREHLTAPAMLAQASYWRERFAVPPPQLALPVDHARPAVPTFAGNTLRIELPAPLPEALRGFCREQRVTLFGTMFAGFVALLRHYTGETDICVGSAFANRRQPELASLVGMLVNTTLLRVDLDDDPSFATLASRARDVILDASANQELPFPEVVRALNPQRVGGRNPMTQILFSANDSPLTEVDLGGAAGTIFEPGNGSAKFDLDVLVIPRAESQRADATHADDRITLLWEYSAELFDEPTMRRMADAYLRLLAGAVADPDTRVSRLPLTDEARRGSLPPEWKPAPVRRLDPVPQQVARRAAQTPDAPAVRHGGTELSYGELVDRSRVLAAALTELGAAPEVVVALCLPAGIELVVAELAVLFTGAAYLPLDVTDPSSRHAALVAGAGAPLTVSALPADLFGRPPAPVRPVAPGQLAYVIGTSGSTGPPKGVLVEHGSLANLCAFRMDALGLGPGDRVTAAHSPAFDAHVGEVWGTLAAGACVCVPDREIRLSPQALHAWLIEERITVADLPTVLGEYLMRMDWPAGGPLRTLVVGGDRLYQRPPPGLPFEVLNVYGPTEATDTATAGLVAPGPDDRPPDIGRPIPGASAYVLDVDLRPVPVGVTGELYVGGAGVARGYAGQPELTRQRFLADPFAERPDARMYRTGDLARYLSTGELECLGRVDDQVKIRGYRIEPGEVAAALRTHPGVADAHVAIAGRTPDARLVAYLQPADPAVVPTSAALREHLAGLVPGYMIPTGYLPVARIPRSAGGKVDRAALPARPADDGFATAGRRMPATDLERRIARVWAEVLTLDRVGTDDNFFDLGGHSLLLGRLADRLHGELGVRVGVLTFFEHPTVAQLAALLDAGTAEAPAADRGEQRAAGRTRLGARRASRADSHG